MKTTKIGFRAVCKTRQPIGHLARRSLMSVTLAVVMASPLSAETWTNLEGTSSIEARMIGRWGDNVVLETSGGRRVTVKMEDLRSDSRIQADDLAAELDQNRDASVQQLQQQAEIAAAPAPDPLPEPEPAPAYQPPLRNVSAEEAFNHMVAQLQAGHVRVLFESLPPLYRKDLEKIIAQAARKLDPSAFDAVTSTIHQVGDTVVTRQNWLFSHPRFESVSAETTAQLREMTLAAANMMRSGFDPQTLKLEDLKTQPFGKWLADYDTAMAAYLHPLMDDSASSGVPEMTFDEGKDGKVTVTQVISEKQKVQFDLEKVDGFWLPSSLAKDWDKQVEQWQAKLDETDDGSVGGGGVAAMVSGVAGPFLQPLRDAGTAKEFHVAMESLIAGAETLGKMIPKDLGIDLGGRQNNGYGYGEEDYGYGEEEEMYGDEYGDEYGR
ncbi:hypothetical protein [Crateriforma conspicua]|uniref:hypothetical protein n=1 Tax=Crateriforma conspicua TaxID=2527996 RepID=UPI00118CE9A0|nr:hypothetical protein [Crateriforma conspicua]QDV62139.1 hypothetical protein Mal65_12720 [Crateriforma conspicua]